MSTELIIHNAWRLDFNLSLSSFESHIKGTRNLVDVALASPTPGRTRILFTSSVSAVGQLSSPAGGILEEPCLDPNASLGNGYGESKFVAERVRIFSPRYQTRPPFDFVLSRS